MEQHMVDGAIFVARQNSSNVLDITYIRAAIECWPSMSITTYAWKKMKKKNEIISVLYTHIKKRKKGEKWKTWQS